MEDGLSSDDFNEDNLTQKDFQTSIQNVADLPDYLRMINQNIMNIDKRCSRQELNLDRVKQYDSQTDIRENKYTNNSDLLELKDIVKQSVDGLSDIFKMNRELRQIDSIEEESNYNKQRDRPIMKKPNKLSVGSSEKPKAAKSNLSRMKTTNEEKSSNSIKKTVSKNTKDKNNSSGFINKSKPNNTNKTNDNNVDDYAHQQNKVVTTEFSYKLQSNKMNRYNGKTNRNNNIAKTNTNLTDNDKKDKTPPNKNYFQFKPKINKENPNSISLSNDNPKTPSIVGRNNRNFKQQFAQKVMNPQRLLTESNHISTSNTATSHNLKKNNKMEKNNSSKHYYTKAIPKKLTQENVLSMMLFLNEYLQTTNTIKDYNEHKSIFDDLSLLLSQKLKETKEVPPDVDKMQSKENDDLSNDTVIKNVIKLQRKWRRYKVQSLLENNDTTNIDDKQFLEAIVIDDLIKAEGVQATKMIKTLNSTIEAFINFQTTAITTKQLSNISLNRISDDDRYKLYKNFVNCHIINRTQRENPGNSLVHNLNEEISYNAILPTYNTAQGNKH